MFSGIGGFELGIQRSMINANCIGYSEIDKYAITVYESHFPGIKNYGDSTKIKPEDLPDFNFLCAGFPCQSFSIAGKREGFSDTRGTLFFDIARILKVKRPKFILLENVKGLLNHDKGQTFRIILQTLEKLGYRTQWMVLNSKFFGVPQNRERVFIIGHLGGEHRPEILPFREDAGEVPEIFGKEIISPTITTENAHGYGNTVTPGQTLAIFKSHRANEIREHNESPTLSQAMGTGGNNVPIVMNLQTRSKDRPSFKKAKKEGKPCPGGSGTIAKVDESYCLDTNCNMGVAYALRSFPRTGTKEVDGKRYQRFEPRGNQTNSLTSVGKDNLVNNSNLLRRLTPIECERLQSFPDDWTKVKFGNKIMSDTQRYKQLGNSVTVNVIEPIIRSLL